jgi:hypothetical protein
VRAPRHPRLFSLPSGKGGRRRGAVAVAVRRRRASCERRRAADLARLGTATEAGRSPASASARPGARRAASVGGRWISPGLDCVGASRATAERNRASRDELAQRHRPVRRPRHGRRPPAAAAWPRRRVIDAMARCPPRARTLSSSAASCPSSRFRARLAAGPWRTLSLLGSRGVRPDPFLHAWLFPSGRVFRVGYAVNRGGKYYR